MTTRTRIARSLGLVIATAALIGLATTPSLAEPPPSGANTGTVGTVREPVFVELSIAPGESTPSEGWVSRALTAAASALEQRGMSKLVVLRVNGGAPTFDQAVLRHEGTRSDDLRYARDAAAFESEAARRLVQLIERIREDFAGLGVSVFGLPLEDSRRSETETARSNDRFGDVIEQLDALVAAKGIILDGGGMSEIDALREAQPGVMAAQRGRPVVYRSNGVWRMTGSDEGELLTDAGGSSGSRARATSWAEPQREASSDSDAWRPADEVIASGEIGLNLEAYSVERARDFDDLHKGRTDRQDEGYLIPGNGWDGPTAQPDAVGDLDAPGYESKVIARWDAIPYQTFHAQYEIGVVAFHLSGIDRVEFAVDGGDWLPVYEMRYNPRTRVWEYFAIVRASDFADGELEVRAIAYPNHGVPRVLAGAITPQSVELGEHSMVLSSNRGGTLPAFEVWVGPQGSDEDGDGTEAQPYATLMRATRALADLNMAEGSGDCADGGVINLMEGEYNYGDYSWQMRTTTVNRWLTIRKAPNAQRGAVRLTTNEGGLNTHLVHLEEITVDGIEITTGINAMGGPPTLWLDKCLLTGREHGDDILFAKHTDWNGGVYATDCEFTRVRKAVTSFALTRNCDIYDITADAFKNPLLVLNCRIADIDATGFIEHPDIMQFFGNFENVIVYGLAAIDNIDAQGMFVRRDSADPGRFTNAAFVNYLVNTDRYSQWTHEGDHILFWHFQIVGQDMMIRDDGDIPTRPARLDNSSIRQSVFNELKYQSVGTPLQRIDIRDNHFVEGEALGENATTGNARFWNAAELDFRPRPGSPLSDRVLELLVPADVANWQLMVPGSIGAVQPADENLVLAMFD
jgi:hypothetical protein